MTLMEVTWSERLTVELNRACKATGLRWSDYAEIAEDIELVTRNTYKKLLEDETEPPSQKKWRRRAYALVLALDLDPADYDLTDEDRGATWADDKTIRERCREQVQERLRWITPFPGQKCFSVAA